MLGEIWCVWLFGPGAWAELKIASSAGTTTTSIGSSSQVPRSALGVVPAVTAPEPAPEPVTEPPPLLPPGEDGGGDMLLPEQPECPPRAMLPV